MAAAVAAADGALVAVQRAVMHGDLRATAESLLRAESGAPAQREEARLLRAGRAGGRHCQPVARARGADVGRPRGALRVAHALPVPKRRWRDVLYAVQGGRVRDAEVAARRRHLG